MAIIFFVFGNCFAFLPSTARQSSVQLDSGCCLHPIALADCHAQSDGIPSCCFASGRDGVMRSRGFFFLCLRVSLAGGREVIRDRGDGFNDAFDSASALGVRACVEFMLGNSERGLC